MPLSDRHRQELFAIVALLVGLFVGLALVPLELTGPVGRGLGRVLRAGLGAGSAFVPLFGVAAGLIGFGWLRRVQLARLAVFCAGMALLLPYAIALVAGMREVGDVAPNLATGSLADRLVGVIPGAIVVGVQSVVGTAGTVIIGLIALSGLTIIVFDWHPFRRLDGAKSEDTVPATATSPQAPVAEPWEPDAAEGQKDGETERRKAKAATPRSAARALPPSADALDQLPALDLLQSPRSEEIDAGEEELERLAQVLVETLATFRVEGKVVGRTTGPVVTQYEVAPAAGVKVGRIAALADDLALAMRAQSIRIVAPIPGRAAVGVEVPNPVPRIVHIRELLETAEWERSRGGLPIVLGCDLEGKPVVADLAKMPHLLIAGATGSGKSVCINAIITSLVYRYTPHQLRMLMIDPKMVELSGYNTLPHLRHPVVTNNKQAAQTLRWAVHEMERRYALFNANGARNVSDFNRKVGEGRELVVPGRDKAGHETGKVKGAKQGGAAEGEQMQLPLPYEEGPLPYIVVIVEELADLMMTVPGDVEKPLALLAQKARATGIHVILATQRPSVNVITGLIKANFSSRIAFRVASKVDSRTILDQNGAEALLGNGDMLFLPPGKSEPIRLQGAFISHEETEALTAWYAGQKARRDQALADRGLIPPEASEEDILAVIRALEAAEALQRGAAETGERDALFREAADTCLQHQLGSTSLLQRKLRIGYGRAARIIDQLHEAGILGPPDGSKPREVLIGAERLDEYCR